MAVRVMSGAPLANVRILDLTMYWAGPAATALLADMGAEVIKIEPRGHHLDLLRFGPGPAAHRERAQVKEDLLDFRVHFNAVNRNKYGTTLDFASREGRGLFLDLVRISDVVVDNFGAGASERLGIDYAALSAVRPDIIVISSNVAGQSGPWREMRGAAQNMQALSGLTYLLGYPDEAPPTGDLYAYCDFNGAEVTAHAILLALVHRELTGEGQYIDNSASAATAMFLGEPIMDFIMNGRSARQPGNAHPTHAPHGTYPCQGQDEWISIAVDTDEEWQALCRVMAAPALATDERFADRFLRQRNRDALDAIIAEWSRQHTKFDLFERLQAAGIAAAPVLRIAERYDDPHLSARNCFTTTSHTKLGEHTLYQSPWKLDRTPANIRFGAPCVGEHNQYVCEGLLGLQDYELEALQEQHVL
jgi:benzylsuccinate CoA-transferase BbsF subunit